MRVRPSRPGLLVGYPGRTTSLAQGGEEVPRSSYWLRRLNKGDVVLVEDTPPPATPAAPPLHSHPQARRKKRTGNRTAGAEDPDPES